MRYGLYCVIYSARKAYPNGWYDTVATPDREIKTITMASQREWRGVLGVVFFRIWCFVIYGDVVFYYIVLVFYHIILCWWFGWTRHIPHTHNETHTYIHIVAHTPLTIRTVTIGRPPNNGQPEPTSADLFLSSLLDSSPVFSIFLHVYVCIYVCVCMS